MLQEWSWEKMAERRMFAKKITESDAFLDMPSSSQALYFHLSMSADDDGFVNNPRKIQRMVGASDDDMKILIAKSFIIIFESGIIVIKHWKMHNYIQSDRYKPTDYQDEKALLEMKKNKSYTLKKDIPEIPAGKPVTDDVSEMYTECIQDVSVGKDRLGKDRLGKVRYIVEYLNSVCGSNYKASTKNTKKHINARLDEGYSIDDFKTVIDKKYSEWKGTKMATYLRPDTLFGAKFEGYLNQIVSTPGPSNGVDDAVSYLLGGGA